MWHPCIFNLPCQKFSLPLFIPHMLPPIALYFQTLDMHQTCVYKNVSVSMECIKFLPLNSASHVASKSVLCYAFAPLHLVYTSNALDLCQPGDYPSLDCWELSSLPSTETQWLPLAKPPILPLNRTAPYSGEGVFIGICIWRYF
jgi:hypothetical protein